MRYNSLNPSDLGPVEASTILKPNRFKPEFGFLILTLNVNVWRFIAIT